MTSENLNGAGAFHGPVEMPAEPAPIVDQVALPQPIATPQRLPIASPQRTPASIVPVPTTPQRPAQRGPMLSFHDRHRIFNISVKEALREYPEPAMHAIKTELKQMLTKKVWTPIITRDLNAMQRKSIIRSSMFIKEKFDPSGKFEKLKARLIAGGDQQDKSLYQDISSATVATSSVFIVATIAALEKRLITVVDVTGAYLNAFMSKIAVYMRISAILAAMVVALDSSYSRFLRHDGTLDVKLDRALYGCVESAYQWGEHIKGTLLHAGFIQNSHEVCCYNKSYGDIQITVVIHVDDLLITCVSQEYINDLIDVLTSKYKDIHVVAGKEVGYLGLWFNFNFEGEVRITAPGFTNDLLSKCRKPGFAVTPATENLFLVRNDVMPPISQEDKNYFHSYVAKLLYISKRTRPDILVATLLLTTRVNCSDSDDMSKLHRILSYINSTPERGIVLRIGSRGMIVRAHIDAAYHVHSDGKSHTGCTVTIGDQGPIYMRSGKQKIVTKSSTEAELVALSDSANVPIHTANFLRSQGYFVPPVILYQDNKSAIALIKKGRSTSDLTKHIALRYFWLNEREQNKEVCYEYCPSADMHANLPKRANFIRELGTMVARRRR